MYFNFFSVFGKSSLNNLNGENVFKLFSKLIIEVCETQRAFQTKRKITNGSWKDHAGQWLRVVSKSTKKNFKKFSEFRSLYSFVEFKSRNEGKNSSNFSFGISFNENHRSYLNLASYGAFATERTLEQGKTFS